MIKNKGLMLKDFAINNSNFKILDAGGSEVEDNDEDDQSESDSEMLEPEAAPPSESSEANYDVSDNRDDVPSPVSRTEILSNIELQWECASASSVAHFACFIGLASCILRPPMYFVTHLWVIGCSSEPPFNLFSALLFVIG